MAENKGHFTKGDPRINRRGRPKAFDALRELSLQIANETAKGDDGNPLFLNGHEVSVAEDILRQWAASRNSQLQRAFIEVAYGKVPDKVEVTGEDGSAVTFRVIYGEDADGDE